MLQIALAFLLGDCVVQLAPALDSVWIGAAALSAPLLLWARPFAVILGRGAILAFLLGIVWVILHAQWRLAHELPSALEGRDLLVQGHVTSIPEVESYGTRFLFELNATADGMPPRIELTWYESRISIHAGEAWQLTVRLKRRRGFANPGGYDYEAQLFREGVDATGYVRMDARNRRLSLPSARYRVLRMRAWLIDKIAIALPGHPMQGIVRGLVVGDQQAIGSEQWQVFARTGISHLVAISGLHIGMVAMLVAWLGGLMARWPQAQVLRLSKIDLRATFGLTAAWVYSLLAGMSVPTQRTLIMLCVYFGALLLRRRIDVWQGFGLALLLVLLVDPFAPLAIGMWLSFGAVAVILINVSGRVGQGRMLSEFLRIQWVVTLGLLPPLLSAFGNVSLIAPLVNLLAIPVFTLLIVPSALMGTLIAAIYLPLGIWLLQLSATLLTWMYDGLQWAASLHLAVWHFPRPSVWAMLMLAGGALLTIAPLLWPLRFCGFLLCLPALCWQTPRLPTGAFDLTLLDVGQGLAVVLRTREHVLLYDAGPAFRSGRDTGELVVLPYLHANGVRRLDMVMASHGDDDHIGGLRSVLRGIPVQRLMVGPSVPHADFSAELCRSGDYWQWDQVEFRVLHPAAEDHDDSDNNSSCVLSVSGAGGSALLLGDVEKPVEKQLLADHLIRPTEVVVAAHHGSRSSSTAEFVQAVKARYVFFSAGYRNRWGFPKTEVVERWTAGGAHAYSTIDSGAVTIEILPEGLAAPQEYRKLYPHYWYTP